MNQSEILKGTTINERLHLSGLAKKFEKALRSDDRVTAYRILRELQVDEKSIISIVGRTFENLKYPNPWNFPSDFSNNLINENKAILNYFNLREVGMGAPLTASIKLISGRLDLLIRDYCGGPALWNESGLKIAFPLWEKSLFKRTFQRLGILELQSKVLIKYKRKFSVLSIETFSNDIITGVDSPIFKTKIVEFDLIKEPILEQISLK